jgi:hypothetical protein
MRLASKLAFGTVWLFAWLAPVEAAVTLTSFGISEEPLFVLDEDNSSFSTILGSTSVAISGNDFGDNLVGSFASANILGQSDFLTITGSATLAPDSFFTVTLFDPNLATATYVGGAWTDLANGSATLSFLESDPGFLFGNVIALDLSTGGAGDAVNAILDSAFAFAIPEPSRALLVLMGLTGTLLRRQRRS